MHKMKRCTKCDKLKPLDEFYKDKLKPDGHRYMCKTCARKKNHHNYLNSLNPEKLKKYNRNKKRKKLLKKGKYICSRCNKIKPLSKFPKDTQNPHGHSYICKDCRSKKDKKYRDKMRQNKKWVEHKRNLRTKRRNSIKDNPRYKLNNSIRANIRHSLKGNKNGKHWENLVDYTLDELKKHLEKQFNDKMTWNNYGSYWHIDHIIPKSKFNFTKPKHIGFKKAWALSNLQPLEATKNLKKKDKLTKAKQEYLVI